MIIIYIYTYMLDCSLTILASFFPRDPGGSSTSSTKSFLANCRNIPPKSHPKSDWRGLSRQSCCSRLQPQTLFNFRFHQLNTPPFFEWGVHSVLEAPRSETRNPGPGVEVPRRPRECLGRWRVGERRPNRLFMKGLQGVSEVPRTLKP